MDGKNSRGDRILRYGTWAAVISLILCIAVVLPVFFLPYPRNHEYIDGQLVYVVTGTFGWVVIIGGIMTVLRIYRWFQRKLIGSNKLQ